jgi:hypothetical protein
MFSKEDFDEYGFLGVQAENFSKGIIESHKDWFDFCFELNAYAQKAKFELEIHNEDGKEVISSCLFIKILNGFQASLILGRFGLTLEAEVVLRSMLETLFLLKACIEDEDFMQEYIKSDDARRLKIMNVAHKYPDWIFKATRKYATEKRRRELREKVKSEGIIELKTWEMAKKAKLESLYDSVYRLLSDVVHSGPKSLGSYTEVDETGKIKVIGVLPKDKDLDFVFVTAGEIMLLTLNSIFPLFSLDKKQEMEIFQLRFQKLVERETPLA